jgi:arabinan endo-1,5-alpha-L-arabinosidase
MNPHDNDFLEDLKSRELDPEHHSSSIRGDVTDHLKDKASDYVEDKVGNVAKKGVEKLGKQAAKQVAEKGIEAGAEAAASGLAATGGATAAGAGIAATTGVETLGIGVVVGGVVAALGNKKVRLAAILGIPVLLFVMASVTILAILTPIMIMKSMEDKVSSTVRAVPGVRGAIMVAKGLTWSAKKAHGLGLKVDDLAGSAVAKAQGAVGDVVDGVTGNGGDFISGIKLPSNPPDQKILDKVTEALTFDSSASRIDQVYGKMNTEGYLYSLDKKYGVSVETTDDKTFSVYYRGKLVKNGLDDAGVTRLMQTDSRLSDAIQSSLNSDVHLWDYSKRVTLAEQGLTTYQTKNLKVDGADTADDDESVAAVQKTNVDSINQPFLGDISSKLKCTDTDCGTWVPTAANDSSSEIDDSITAQSGFKPTSTVIKKVGEKTAAGKDSNDTYQWYLYVAQMAKAAELTNDADIKGNAFIQGVLSARKDQAARQWSRWSTAIDQYKSVSLTDKSASALFSFFNDGADTKAYHLINGETGGRGFSESQKINDNQANPVATIYNQWKKNNGAAAVQIDKIINGNFTKLFSLFLNGVALKSFVLASLGNGADTTTALQNGYAVASNAVLPVCDGTDQGASSNFVNCLYAGAQTTYRDIGISNYGLNGKISKADYDKTVAYVDTIDTKQYNNQSLLARITDLKSSKSFAKSLTIKAALPVDIAHNPVSLISYIASFPGKTIASLFSPLSKQVVAASDDDVTTNNIDRAGIPLDQLLATPLSDTLNQSYGDISSCSETVASAANLCKSDESTLLAWQAKLGLLPSSSSSGSFDFRIASMNSLDGDAHPGPSSQVAGGGCSHKECEQIRAKNAAKIIKSGADIGGTPIDVIGLQEMTPTQYTALKDALAGEYDAFPSSSSGNGLARSIFWNKSKFSLVPGQSGLISYPWYGSAKTNLTWVKLQTSGGTVYVYNVHPVFGGYPGENNSDIKRAKTAQIVLADIKSRVTDGSSVFITGDFNETFAVRPSRDDSTRDKLAYCILTADGSISNTFDIWKGRSGKCPTKTGGDIDHVYASSDVTVTDWQSARGGVIAHTTDHNDIIVADVSKQGGGGAPVAYKNPVYADGEVPDPAVIRGADGTYHIYATGFQHFVSKDLVHWKKLGGDSEIFKGKVPNLGSDHWAPDIQKTGDHYTLLYSGGSPKRIGYAVSSSAGGPFTDMGTLVNSMNSSGYTIDPNMINVGGNEYILYFGSSRVGITATHVRLSGNKLSTYGAKKVVLKGDNSFTTEAAYVIKRNDYYYLFYSVGDYRIRSDYAVRIARSKDPFGSFVRKSGDNTILKSNKAFVGPGHNSVATDDAGKDWIVYHARYPTGSLDRHLMIDPITYDSAGWPVINGGNGPSSGLQKDGPATGKAPATGGVQGGISGQLSWPVNRQDWPKGSMPVAECGLEYRDGTVHTGMDISVPFGTPVYSATNGTVTDISPSWGAIRTTSDVKGPDGKTVFVNYQHLSQILVKNGQAVKIGQLIGKSGKTGTVSPHLHFSVWKVDKFLSGHVQVSSSAGKAILANMYHPMNFLPADGRNVSECKKPYVVP